MQCYVSIVKNEEARENNQILIIGEGRGEASDLKEE